MNLRNLTKESATGNPALALLLNLTIQCYTNRFENHSWLLDTETFQYKGRCFLLKMERSPNTLFI